MCQEILDLLMKHLLPKTKMNEGIVFLQKMKGDYMRYIAEYASG
jgi:14-3-3 protein epsilon